MILETLKRINHNIDSNLPFTAWQEVLNSIEEIATEKLPSRVVGLSPPTNPRAAFKETLNAVIDHLCAVRNAF